MRKSLLAAIGPGLLVAATGVGAGDLAGAALAGTRLGTAVLWAVVVGAAFKFVLNEGLARWQIATGETLLEGLLVRAPAVRWPFLLYFLVWSFLVAAALMSACGVAGHAILPVFEDPAHDKILYGAAHSLVALWLVRVGGFALFEKVMSAAIVMMFAVVAATAVSLWPGTDAVVRGILVPSIPPAGGEGVQWTIALLGGVGGTVTVLCYGYWIRAQGRSTDADLPACRVDLGLAYAMTGLFGIGMVIIGSTIQVDGGGASLIVKLAARLGEELGPVARHAFLLGAWAAIASSLLGVWQSVPYLFADIVRRGPAGVEETSPIERTPAYRRFAIGLAVVPMIGLWVGFARMQKLYAVCGALFIPMLAVALLFLNRERFVGPRHKSRPFTAAALVVILLFFLVAFWLELQQRLT